MPRIELSAGPIDYTDTGGDGPVLVFTHGFPMTGPQWRKVVPLIPGYRYILPTLPMGSHQTPMKPGADLPRGRYVEIADSWTLVPEDQPQRLAEELTGFLAETGAPAAK